MKIVSSAFENRQSIPVQYTCKDKGINPSLHFLDIPQNAKSLVLIMDDPDAPSGDFVHWVIYNMPVSAASIAENSKPAGIEGATSIGKPGYIGPCPPSGTHRYFFKLYALDTMLTLPVNADKRIVTTAMNDHIVSQAELVGLFSK